MRPRNVALKLDSDDRPFHPGTILDSLLPQDIHDYLVDQAGVRGPGSLNELFANAAPEEEQAIKASIHDSIDHFMESLERWDNSREVEFRTLQLTARNLHKEIGEPPEVPILPS